VKRHILDSSALLRFLTRDAGGELVTRLVKQARDEGDHLSMSVVNWGEVFYTVARRRSLKEAGIAMEAVDALPIKIVDAERELTRAAAKLKVNFALPYADCFAAALTGADGVLVTADIKDFKRVPGIRILALPEHRSKS
jgi:predicted nucleic acid-binding protein